MMQLKFIRSTSLCLLLYGGSVGAQQTTVFTEANLAYKRGLDFFEKGIYGAAQREFQVSLDQLRPAVEPESKLLRGRAELYLAKSAVRTGQPNAEQLIADYIRNYSPDPLAKQAIVEMGNYYYNAQEFDKALRFFEMLNDSEISGDLRTEAYFKKGYAYFVRKQFPKAKACFEQVKEKDGEYFYPANYYYGMTAFFENKFDEAIKSFQRVEKSKTYAQYIPYYLTQIYFAQHDYDKVITYGTRAAQDPKLRTGRELNQLIGQAYFEKKDYPNAVKYLEVGGEGNNKMREEDFYQLGFAQYRVGKYVEAGKNLENLNRTANKMGQNALVMLGDCYLRTGDRGAARNAFATASRMNFDAAVQEDALFNYAKLSYELKYIQDAVNGLEGIPSGSRYYTDAQNLLGDLLLQTRDYEGAIKTINGIQNKTAKIREAYQKALLYRGIQLMQDNKPADAKSYFERSLSESMSTEAKAIANFWLGDIANTQKDYATSQRYMSQFLTLGKGLRTLPEDASMNLGNYIQGYNYLKQKNYQSALDYFKEAVSGIKRDKAMIYGDDIKQNVLGDAILRAGDCMFKRNKYDEALKYYDEAVTSQYAGYIYALYQKGIIQGLRNNKVEKLLALDKIADQYPNSEFAPAALLEAGATYQEMNQLDNATRALNRLLNDYKGKTDLAVPALMRLGLIASNQGNQEQAASYYKQVFQYQPNAVDAKAALERLEDIYVHDLNRPDDYFTFLKTVPGMTVDGMQQDNLLFKSAETQYEQGNYDRAVSSFTTYLTRFPSGVNALQAYYNRGESYAILKQYDAALIDYETVANRGTGSKYYLKALGKAALIAYNGGKNFAKAYELYDRLEKASTSEEQKFEAQLGAMRSAYRINRTDAVYDMATKVANNPRATKEQAAIASLYLGKIAFDKKDYANSKTALLKAIATLKPDEQTAEAEFLVASIDYAQRNLDAALDRCDRASQNSTSPYWSAKCVVLQSDIYADKNDLFNARAALEAVIDNFKEDSDAQMKSVVSEARAKLKILEEKEKKKSRIDPNKNNGIIELDNGK
ncbi:MAG: hypothetical protein RL329_1641 [Bacteroidota bacterium]|jgi:tetratricopeptide (TPR) repeat protein